METPTWQTTVDIGHSKTSHCGILSTPWVRRIKRKPSAGKEAGTEAKHDEKRAYADQEYTFFSHL